MFPYGLRRMLFRLTALVLGPGVILLSSHVTTEAEAARGIPLEVLPAQSACTYGPTRRFSQVRHPAVREASALVASQQWPGVYWTLNDSGNAPALFAFDERGEPRGTFRVSNAANVDWESLQPGPDGEGGYALYIGDAGDNHHRRREAVIYRVPEPEPAPAGAPSQDVVTASATAFRFVFPSTSSNIEAMLVHPVTGEVVLIGREVNGLNLLYHLPVPLDSRTTMTADLIDVLDARTLDPSGAQVTDAAVSSDGRLVVLRTYASALLYELPRAASLASIWAQEPRVYQLQDGPKGEGITFRAGSADLISIGEGVSPFLYQTSRHC